MAVANVSTIFCVQQATGTDTAVNEAILTLPELLMPAEFGDMPINVIRALPGVISAIDTARSDPDDLYITADPGSGRASAIWPGNDSTVPVQAGQSFEPALSFEFEHSQNLSLWDYDSVSDDDLLGSVTMFASEQGQGEIAKLARSTVENSAYYVIYRVD